MKILFVHHRYHTNLFNWFRGFRQNGHEVKLLVYKPDTVNLPDLPESDYLPPSRWSMRKMERNPRKRGDGVDSFSPYYYPSFKSLYRYFKEQKPKLVVIRPVFSRFGYMVLFLSVLFRCRIVFHSRIRIHRHYTKPKLLVFKFVLGILNAYWMSPCKGNPEKYPLASKRLVYFPFLIQPQVENRTYFKGGKVNILCVAKYYTSKNPGLMLEAFIKLRQEFEDIRLTICGTGDENGEYYESMVKRKEELPFAEDIRLLINQPLTRMSGLYASHDIFVLPTRHDPASFTVLEAMAHGLAVLTTDVDGSSGYIEEGKNGYIIRSGDLMHLIERVKAIIQDRQRLESFGERSLDMVKLLHEPGRVSADFIKTVAG
ncbi:glycosyltransferase family 4 protein [Roseivirga sp. UBA1976]|uniref:glycosyltransferase family 4 protein n=1 Tax=Roseivirga sp. UBA1976 TaxID=1947386 RepID=UPI00257C0DEE|nr:glycosyltransferase family 4 protein [Roseivirga sp. UBA1976]